MFVLTPLFDLCGLSIIIIIVTVTFGEVNYKLWNFSPSSCYLISTLKIF